MASVKSLILLSFLLFLSACAPNTGLFAGGTWQSSGLVHQHIHTLIVDPNNAQLIYAGDEQNGAFVSTDAGQHWKQSSIGLALPISIQALSFDASGKKLYAATDAGLFVSTDAAYQWNAVSKGTGPNALPTDSYTALAFDLSATHTIYLGTSHHGVLKSVDDGISWSDSSTGFPSGDAINGLTFDAVHHELWAATAQGVYLSTDGAVSWQARNTGLPAGITINTVQPASINGGQQGLIYAGTTRGFYLSQDSGIHWAMSKVSLVGISINNLLVDFRYPSTVYIATSVGAFQSPDSGESWEAIATGLPKGQPVYDLAIGGPGNSQLYAAAADVYMFPGTSGGLSITHLIPILVILLLFYLLYRQAFRRNNRSRPKLDHERPTESPSPTPPNIPQP